MSETGKPAKMKPLIYTDYEIYSKYKRLLRNGESSFNAIDMIAQLNATDVSQIKSIIEQERTKENAVGERAYIKNNSRNISGNRW